MFLENKMESPLKDYCFRLFLVQQKMDSMMLEFESDIKIFVTFRIQFECSFGRISNSEVFGDFKFEFGFRIWIDSLATNDPIAQPIFDFIESLSFMNFSIMNCFTSNQAWRSCMYTIRLKQVCMFVLRSAT